MEHLEGRAVLDTLQHVLALACTQGGFPSQCCVCSAQGGPNSAQQQQQCAGALWYAEMLKS